ncbi:MAG TPA: hypothetical protein VMZ28_23685 [Kofleriaceae bacterium]|nr:hypothetical protein [Kofleriaceae bacterium]
MRFLGPMLLLTACYVPPPAAGTPAPAGATAPAPAAAAAPAQGGPIDASTRYIPEPDPAKAEQIRQRMWAIMTAVPCWVMKNTTTNYSFSGVNDYRYVGYETTAGQIQLNSIGSFGGYDTADVTISSTQYWINIVDAGTIVISSLYNGSLVSNTFFAVPPGQQCN